MRTSDVAGMNAFGLCCVSSWTRGSTAPDNRELKGHSRVPHPQAHPPRRSYTSYRDAQSCGKVRDAVAYILHNAKAAMHTGLRLRMGKKTFSTDSGYEIILGEQTLPCLESTGWAIPNDLQPQGLGMTASRLDPESASRAVNRSRSITLVFVLLESFCAPWSY